MYSYTTCTVTQLHRYTVFNMASARGTGMTQASPPTSRPPTPVLFLALVGGDTRQRDAARETWLNQHHVRALAEGSCAYSFYVAAGEHEAAQVRAHEWVDTVAVLSQAPVAFRNTWWARAWGVDGNTSFPYNGPKTVGSARRWLFLLINTMRHALLSSCVRCSQVSSEQGRPHEHGVGRT